MARLIQTEGTPAWLTRGLGLFVPSLTEPQAPRKHMRYRVWAFGYLLPLGPLIGTAAAMDPDGEQTCQHRDVIANLLCGIGQPFYDALQIKLDMTEQGARPHDETWRRRQLLTPSRRLVWYCQPRLPTPRPHS